MLLTKRDSITNTCTSERFGTLLTDKNYVGCLDRKTYQTNLNVTYGERIYIDEQQVYLNGIYGEYDASGVAVTVPLTYPEFHIKMNTLHQKNFITDNTYFVNLILNSFDRNSNRVIRIRATFELISTNFYYSLDLKISSIENTLDGTFYLAIAFSIIYLISEILKLKKAVNEEELRKYNNLNACKKFVSYFEINFKKPDLFAIISKKNFYEIIQNSLFFNIYFKKKDFLNIIYFYVLIIARLFYEGNVNNIANLSNIPKDFVDLETYMQNFEMINYLNCSNIIVFIFIFVNNLSIFSREFHIIQKNLSMVI